MATFGTRRALLAFSKLDLTGPFWDSLSFCTTCERVENYMFSYWHTRSTCNRLDVQRFLRCVLSTHCRVCKKCARPCTQDAQDCDCRQDAQYFAQSAQEYAWMHNLQHFVKCGDISFFRRAHNVSTSQVHRQLNCFAHILARNSIKPTKDGLHALHSERKRRKPCTCLTAAQPP